MKKIDLDINGWSEFILNEINTDSFVAFEVGVADKLRCRLNKLFSKTNSRFELFEPLPFHFKDLESYNKLPNVTVHNKGIYKESGEVSFIEYGGESYIEGEFTPGVARRRPTDNTHTIEVVTMDEVDPGNIDVLLADVEGCEWYIVDKLISRPKFISLEITTKRGDFINSNKHLIDKWMNNNNYTHKYTVGGDYIFIKND